MFTQVVGLEVHTVIVMKSTVFWDIMPCKQSIESQQTFGGTSPPSAGSKDKPSEKPV
jgi:hypothetical protein